MCEYLNITEMKNQLNSEIITHKGQMVDEIMDRKKYLSSWKSH